MANKMHITKFESLTINEMMERIGLKWADVTERTVIALVAADDDDLDRGNGEIIVTEMSADQHYPMTLVDMRPSAHEEYALYQVMTPAQIEREFGLSSGVVRNMLDGIPHRRPDERTILIPRSYAEQRWAHRRLTVGDTVRVRPHTQYGDLRGGAVHSDMHSHQHNGYHAVKVVSVSDDGSVEVEVAGDMVDVVPAMYCEKINV